MDATSFRLMQLLLDYGVPLNVLGLVGIVVLKLLKVGVKKEKILGERY